MGAWGDGPWENDAAADWAGDLFQRTGLAEQIAAGLSADINESPEIVRSAAHLVVLLGRVYLWPINRLQHDLQHAENRLEQLLELDWEPADELRKELVVIRERMKKPPTGQTDQAENKLVPATSADEVPVESKLQFAWSMDLATVEQRKNASALRWKVIAPSVRLLEPVGENMLLAGTHQHLQLIEASSGRTIRDLVENERWQSGVHREYLLTPGGLLVLADNERTVVRNLPDGDVVFECEHNSRAASTAISADGRRMVVLTWDGVLHVYDIEGRAELFRLEHAPPQRAEDASCAVTPDGIRAASSWPGSVCFWDLEGGKLIRRQRNKHAGVKLTGDGKEAITRSGTGYVLWDAATGNKIRNIKGATNVVSGHHLISPNNRYVCEVAPFKRHRQRGEVCSVREWTTEDAPYGNTTRVDFAWLGDEQVATWRNVVDEGGMATCEMRLWTIDPLKLVGTALVEPPLLAIENENQTSRRPVQFFRIAAAEDSRMIFAGDGNAHVYAFQIKV